MKLDENEEDAEREGKRRRGWKVGTILLVRLGRCREEKVVVVGHILSKGRGLARREMR